MFSEIFAIVGAIDRITGITVIKTMAPITDGFDIVADIAIVALIAVISRTFGELFEKIGEKAGIDKISVLGLISSLANANQPYSTLLLLLISSALILSTLYMPTVIGFHTA